MALNILKVVVKIFRIFACLGSKLRYKILSHQHHSRHIPSLSPCPVFQEGQVNHLRQVMPIRRRLVDPGNFPTMAPFSTTEPPAGDVEVGRVVVLCHDATLPGRHSLARRATACQGDFLVQILRLSCITRLYGRGLRPRVSWPSR